MGIQKLYLELTDRCNLNCTICYRQSFTEEPRDLAEKTYQKILAEIVKMPSLTTIVLGGIGEPTCASNFKRVVADLKGYSLVLTTNGASLMEEDLYLIASNIDQVVVSIDGMDNNFLQIRGVDLNQVTTNVKKLIAIRRQSTLSKLQVMLQCVLSADNVGDALALVDLAGELGVDGLIFSNLIPQVEQNKDKILYTLNDTIEMKSLFNALQIRAIRKGIQLTLPNRVLKTERFCPFIEDEATFINADGDVIPCYRLSHGYTEYVFGREKQIYRHSFGNINTATLSDIWESSAYTSYRDRVRNNRYPSCIDCDLVDGCAYVVDSVDECWGGTPSCSDCLWSRRIVICP